ncbi:MAG: J domain-containing protein [Polyangiaceae bacterium]
MNVAVLRALYDLGLGRRSGIASAFGAAVHVEAGAVGAGVARSTLAAWRDAKGGAVVFEDAPTRRLGIAVPLVAWVRSAIATGLSEADVVRLERTFTRAPIDRTRVRRADLDSADAATLDALGFAADLRDVGRHARVPRHGVASFVRFLEVVGARPSSEPSTAPAPALVDRRATALSSLGLERDAPSSSVRTTFRRLARLLHPDMHPHAGESERRRLAARFAEVHAAYQELTVSG